MRIIISLLFVFICGIALGHTVYLDTPVKFKFCMDQGYGESWKCEITARFKDMDACKRWRLAWATRLNWDGLEKGEEVVAKYSVEGSEIQSSCEP